MHEKGWEKNYIGRLFSHKFGYGLLDAGELVKLARTWKESPPQVPSCNCSMMFSTTCQHICETRIETVERELGKNAGMRLNVSLITDGCDNMLSKVLALLPPQKSRKYKCCR